MPPKKIKLKKKVDDNESGAKDDIGPKYLDMYSNIYSIRQDLDRIRKPVGTRENPVRTCRDLYYGHPQFKDGTLKLSIIFSSSSSFNINLLTSSLASINRFHIPISITSICMLYDA